MGLMSNLRVAYYLVRREFKIWTYYKVNFILDIIEVLIDLIVMAIIALASRDVVAPKLSVYGGDYLSYVVLGLICNRILSMAVNAPYSSIGRAFWQRRIELFLSSPLNPVFLVSALSLGLIVRESIMAILYLVAALALGLRVSSLGLTSILAMLLGFTACLGLGLMSASLFYLLEAKAGSDPLRWIINISSRLFSGLYYPLEVLPFWCRYLALLTPHTYVFDAVRRLLLNGTSEPILVVHYILLADPVLIDLFCLLAYSLISVLLGYFMTKSGFKIALKDARLSWWS